jgi:phospholipid/cholesterol/gamma-HCH transport system permease protein
MNLIQEYTLRSLTFFAWLGNRFIEFIQELGALFLFFVQGLFRVLPFQFRKTLNQVYFIGVKSIFVIVLVGIFTGMVLGLQGYYTLVKFGSEGMLGAAVALSVIRELGPVLSAIMIIGRGGSSMAAEIGIMRITEQIDALYTMDINPMRYLFSPRLVASCLSFPLLTALFDVIAIIGGYVTGVMLLGVNSSIYFSRMESLVDIHDVMSGFYKSFVFGSIVVTVCCYQGYVVHKRREGFGAKGVSLATTNAVVLSCVLVLVVDYVMTSFLL